MCNCGEGPPVANSFISTCLNILLLYIETFTAALLSQLHMFVFPVVHGCILSCFLSEWQLSCYLCKVELDGVI